MRQGEFMNIAKGARTALSASIRLGRSRGQGCPRSFHEFALAALAWLAASLDIFPSAFEPKAAELLTGLGGRLMGEGNWQRRSCFSEGLPALPTKPWTGLPSEALRGALFKFQ